MAASSSLPSLGSDSDTFRDQRSASKQDVKVLKLPLPPPPGLEKIAWYHYDMSRHVAESLLMTSSQDGGYLLRDNGRNPGDYTLSVRTRNSVKHFTVSWNGKEFCFGFGTFPSVDALLGHFNHTPIIGGERVLIKLQSPYPRVVNELESYEHIDIHAELGSVSDIKQSDFSIASKEGYLTKLGSWRKDKTPINTIDLTHVQSVAPDESQKKPHCFTLTMDTRTYYFYAETAKEADEWINILQWKLNLKEEKK